MEQPLSSESGHNNSEGEPEKILYPCYYSNGTYALGVNHTDALRAVEKIGIGDDDLAAGYVTNRRRFIEIDDDTELARFLLPEGYSANDLKGLSNELDNLGSSKVCPNINTAELSNFQKYLNQE